MSPVLLLLLACGAPMPAPTTPANPAPKTQTPADPVIDGMRAQPLAYTRHGKCRMACRDISEDEVEAILREDGTLDPSRSRDDGPCPSHALEGKTDDGQQVRIVYAACARETRVVTAIDLGREWPCDCD